MKHFLLLTFISIIFFSCSEISAPFCKEESLAISVPEWNENLPSLVEWHIVCISYMGIEEFILKPYQNSIELGFERNVPSAVLAFPITELGGKPCEVFYPAGFIYPFETKFSWEKGFCASVFKKVCIILRKEKNLLQSKTFISGFNWLKFIETLDSRCNASKAKGKVYNPWALGVNECSSLILSRSFSSVFFVSNSDNKDKFYICIY